MLFRSLTVLACPSLGNHPSLFSILILSLLILYTPTFIYAFEGINLEYNILIFMGFDILCYYWINLLGWESYWFNACIGLGMV